MLAKRLPIYVSAPLMLGLPVLVLGLGLSLMWNSKSRDAASELADQNIQQIHELVATKIEDVLSVPQRVCSLNVHAVLSGVLDPDDLHSWRSTFMQQLDAFDMLSAITWGSADGRSAWISRYADGSLYWAVKEDASRPDMLEWPVDASGNIPSEPSGNFQFNLFSRPWFVTPRDQGVPAWSPPYVWVGGGQSEGKTLGISYGVPLYDPDGELFGVIDADFSLNDLSGFLASVAIGKTGVAILASGDGILLATSNDAETVANGNELVYSPDSEDPLISTVSEYMARGGVSPESHTEIVIGGEPHYLRVSQIGHRFGLDWSIATVIPETDFMSEIDAGFRRSSTISLVAVGIAVVLGVGVANWLLDPLKALVAAVRQIRDGDLDTRVEIRHAPEYMKLGSAINEMSSALKESRRSEVLLGRELDHRVKNMLAQIVALCRQAAGSAMTDGQILEDLTERVAGLARLHELLSEEGHASVALATLVESCCGPYLGSEGHRLSANGPEIRVGPKAAICLAMVINELATNARKHGALAIDDGRIQLQWSSVNEDQGGDTIEFEWTEHHSGVLPEKLEGGLGTQLLQSVIAYELSGSSDLTLIEDGIRYTARFPAADINCDSTETA